MELNLTGKKILVTGASMGIGEATAEVFAREGAGLVHVTARSGNLLESLKTRIESSSDCTVQTHTLDLTDTGARQTLIDATIDVDILVNNAGAIPSGSMETVNDDAWRAGWELKVFGYINMCRVFYKHMTERKSGVIINNIGNSGENPDIDYIAGSSGNASLMAFSRALGGRSLDHGVRVVAVNPGPIDTGRMEKMLKQRAGQMLGDQNRWQELLGRFPGGRGGTAEEVADLIAFMASERAAYISGCVVTVDGGITARRSVV